MTLFTKVVDVSLTNTIKYNKNLKSTDKGEMFA
jgi:hypothetical protein